MRVLLVDDHAMLRQALSAALDGEADMEVIGEAANGRAAVEQADRLHPDIVLMDINMPVMNGVDATHAIHATHPEVCIIVLSMHEGLRATMREAGAVGYVTKSAAPEELLAVMRGCYARLREELPPAA